MARPKSDTVTVPVKLQKEVAEILRTLVKRDGLNQSMFVQNAVVRAIRNYRSPLEFISEGRDKKDREDVPGAINTKLDRPDGVPLAYDSMNTERDWKETWRLSANCRQYIDDMRTELSRPVLTNTEWSAIVRYMGSEPGSGKRKTVTELTTDD